MNSIILEQDHFKRNCIIFITALIVFISFGTFYFFSNRGCMEYASKLKSCTPFKCTQRVMGFDSKYVVHTALNVSREIIGPEKDPFFNKSTCNIIEVDDTTKTEKLFCKYSDKTLKNSLERAEILFGNTLPYDATAKKLSLMEIFALRAKYASRTAEQESECETKGGESKKAEVVHKGFVEVP